jgi:hypothetical protein
MSTHHLYVHRTVASQPGNVWRSHARVCMQIRRYASTSALLSSTDFDRGDASMNCRTVSRTALSCSGCSSCVVLSPNPLHVTWVQHVKRTRSWCSNETGSTLSSTDSTHKCFDPRALAASWVQVAEPNCPYGSHGRSKCTA